MTAHARPKRRRAPASPASTLLASTLVVALLAPTLTRPAWAADGKAKPADKGAGDKPAESDEASERFRAGVGFYKDGDFTAALVEFKKAYELAPNYRVLFNLGQTSQELKDYASALTSFERYLREGGKEIDAARQKKVQAWVDDLKKKVGTLTIETAEGAEILVDDVPVGIAPLPEPVVVNAGRRKLAASLSGHAPVQRMVDVTGTEQLTVKLELTKIEAPRPEPGPEPAKQPPPPPPEPETPVAAWVMLSVTAASAIATGVMGGLALSARSDLDAELATFPGNRAAIDDAQSSTQSFSLAADVLAGVTVAGAAATVILFVVSGGDSGDPAAPVEGESSVSVRAGPGPGLLGLGLTGTF